MNKFIRNLFCCTCLASFSIAIFAGILDLEPYYSIFKAITIDMSIISFIFIILE